jgi:hypothetical protein
MRRCDGQHIDVVCLNCAGETRIAFDDQRYAAADHVREGRRWAASIRHRLQFDAGFVFQKQSGQMRYSPYSGGGK